MAILVHYSAQNYIKQNSDRAKDFTFRMFGLSVRGGVKGVTEFEDIFSQRISQSMT